MFNVWDLGRTELEEKCSQPTAMKAEKEMRQRDRDVKNRNIGLVCTWKGGNHWEWQELQLFKKSSFSLLKYISWDIDVIQRYNKLVVHMHGWICITDVLICVSLTFLVYFVY